MVTEISIDLGGKKSGRMFTRGMPMDDALDTLHGVLYMVLRLV